MYGRTTATHALATPMQLQKYVGGVGGGGGGVDNPFLFREKNTYRGAKDMCQNTSNSRNIFASTLKVNKMKLTGVTYVPLIVFIESNKNVDNTHKNKEAGIQGSY